MVINLCVDFILRANHFCHPKDFLLIMWNTLIHLLLLSLITVLFFMIGAKLLDCFRLNFYSFASRIFFSITFGIGVIVTIVFFCGIAGILVPKFIILLSLSALTGLLYQSGKKEGQFIQGAIRQQLLRIKRLGVGYQILVFAFMIYILFNLVRCLTPVLNGDSLHAYLYVPKLYMINHGIYSIEWSDFDDLPMNIFMLNAYGLMLYSDIMAQLINGWLLGLLNALAVYLLAKRFADKKAALAAAVIFYCIPTVSWLIYSTKIDLGYTVFEVAFWLLFIEWLNNYDRKMLHLAGIFLGFSIGSKYHAIFTFIFVLVLISFINIFRERSIRKSLVTILMFSILVGLTAAPSYVKNAIFTGDPIYPFLTNPEFGKEEGINQYSGVIDFIRFQYQMIFGKDYFVKSYVMMDKPIGFMPFLFLPFSIVFLFSSRRNLVIWIIMIYYILLSFIIFKSVFPYPRHFLPAIALICAVNALGIRYAMELLTPRLAMTVLTCLIVVTIFLNEMPVFSRYFRNGVNDYLSFVVGKTDRLSYLENKLYNTNRHMSFEMMQYLKTMTDDVRIMSLDYKAGYYLDRPLVKKDYIFTIQDLDTLLQMLKRDKITHFYFSESGLNELKNTFYCGYVSPLIRHLDSGFAKMVYQSGDKYLYELVDYSLPSLAIPDKTKSTGY